MLPNQYFPSLPFWHHHLFSTLKQAFEWLSFHRQIRNSSKDYPQWTFLQLQKKKPTWLYILEAYIVKIVNVRLSVSEYSASPHMFWFPSRLLDTWGEWDHGLLQHISQCCLPREQSCRAQCRTFLPSAVGAASLPRVEVRNPGSKSGIKSGHPKTQSSLLFIGELTYINQERSKLLWLYCQKKKRQMKKDI